MQDSTAITYSCMCIVCLLCSNTMDRATIGGQHPHPGCITRVINLALLARVYSRYSVLTLALPPLRFLSSQSVQVRITMAVLLDISELVPWTERLGSGRDAGPLHGRKLMRIPKQSAPDNPGNCSYDPSSIVKMTGQAETLHTVRSREQWKFSEGGISSRCD